MFTGGGWEGAQSGNHFSDKHWGQEFRTHRHSVHAYNRSARAGGPWGLSWSRFRERLSQYKRWSTKKEDTQTRLWSAHICTYTHAHTNTCVYTYKKDGGPSLK